MSHLVLELRPGETMLVNGAAIRFRNRCRVELVSRARFLFGKQIREPRQDDTPVEQLYCAIQTLYAGPPGDGEAAADAVRTLLDRLDREASPLNRQAAAEIRTLVGERQLYAALRSLRGVIRQDRVEQQPM